MAAPVNLTDLEDLFGSSKEPIYVGKSKEWWYKHGRVMTEQSAFIADSDCRGLVARVLELQRDDYWRQFSNDWGEFCLEAFGRPAEWIEQVVEGVRVLHLQNPSRLGRPVPAREAAAQHHAQAALDLDGTFAEAGDNQHTLKEGGPDIVRTKGSEGGNSAAYLAARLKKAGRDDLLEQIGPDKPYRSVRAAAIEAGIVKDVPTVRLTEPDKAAASIVARMGPEWAAHLSAALANAITTPTQP